PRSVGQGHVDTVIAEADDIGVAVVVDVRKQARVAVLAAPAGGRTKGAEYKLGRPKICRHAHLPSYAPRLRHGSKERLRLASMSDCARLSAAARRSRALAVSAPVHRGDAVI